jgi:predicted DNA-binding transcriptional regulator AlpA
MHKPELLNTGDAAAYLGISRGTLEHWRTESPPKGPPYVRLGFQVRYRTADLVGWIERNVVLLRKGEDDD